MSDFHAYRLLASGCMMHPVLLVLYAMMRWSSGFPDRFWFGLWWFWPVALFLFYRAEKLRWMAPGIAGFLIWCAAAFMAF